MRLIFAAALALLSACSPKPGAAPENAPLTIEDAVAPKQAPPAGTAPELDPTQLDFSRIELAVRLPSTFRADADGAKLQINITNPRLGVNIAETFPLVPTVDVNSPFLTSELKDGFSIWTYGTAPGDNARLAALSGEMARLKAEDPGQNLLNFGAVAPGCWNEPEQTPGSLARTLYIRVVPEEDFQVFVPEQVLTEGEIPGLETYWGACEPATP